MANPPYNNARGAATQIGKPPFDFDGVVMRTFPLRASMRSLTRFCDQYLNIVPKEVAYFQPAGPFALISAINYGRMGPEASSFGWISQNEVAVSVPLTRSRRANGKLVFEDWASVSPFIFVDDESSLATGRDVYGWPKALAWLSSGVDQWARHPESPQDVFVLSSMVFPELFAGQRQEPRALLEVWRQPEPSVARFPPDPRSPLNPLVGLPRAMIESMSVFGQVIQALAAPPMRGYPTERNPGAIPQMMRRATDYLDILNRLPVSNTINLKQFRDARDANAACYQAITAAPMTVVSYNKGGLLGDQAQLRGDPSGGYSLHVHRYPTFPIIESLGIEVEQEIDAGDHSIAVLKPMFPFWVDVDFNYGQGELVCWRPARIGWRRAAKPRPSEEPEATEEEAEATEEEPAPRKPVKHLYNTARGAATEAVTGPFRFPNVTVRVLPLLANPARLAGFCREYLANDLSFFTPWGPYVYLIVTTFDEMSSETYDVGWWANRQVTFSFPVRWYRRKDIRPGAEVERAPEGELVGTALLTAFAYTDSELGATTGREVQGLPMVKASIVGPESSWLGDSGPARRSEMLRLETHVYAAYEAGQHTREEVLLEITPRSILPDHDQLGWRRVAANWGERLYAEMVSRVTARTTYRELHDGLRALAIGVMRGEGRPLNEISLRQFRDIEEPEEACYQALTLTRTTLQEIHELCEIEQPLHVAVHRYPSQPIVETLGLRVKTTDVGGDSVVDYLEPVRPFWAKVAMRVDLGEDVFWRAGPFGWRPNTPAWYEPRAALEGNPAWSERTDLRDFFLVSGVPDVAPELVRRIDADPHARRNVHDAWRLWRYPRGEEPACMSRQDAREVIGEDPRTAGIPPQFAIEALLENEWGRQSPSPGGRRPSLALPAGFLGNPEVRAEYCKKLGFEPSGDHLVHSDFERQLEAALAGDSD